MKRTLALAVLLASGLALNATNTLSAAAQTAAAPAAPAAPVAPVTAKVAVLAFQVAVAQTNEGQRNFADVQKKFEPKQAQLKAQSDEIDMYNALASKVYEVVAKYATDQGYTLVVDVSEQQSPVLWAADSTNITAPIIAAYNAKSGVPAPPPAAAPAAQGPKPPAVKKAPATPAAPAPK
jgi:outer membrane protein